MNDCIRHMRAAPNVRVYVVEVAFGDRPYEVTGQSETDIQFRTTDEMWVKECSIDIAAARLPVDAKYIGYADGDFTFTRHDWALEAIHMLQHHQFVQLFSSYADLTGETATSFDGHRPYRLNSTFAWNFLHQRQFREEMERRTRTGGGEYFRTKTKSAKFPFGYWPGAPGGAWAWRRSAFDTVGGLLDTCILGSGDYHMAVGLCGLPDEHVEMILGIPGYVRAIKEWQRRAAKLEANIGCVDNFAVHHWHGNKKSRGYGDRPAILKDHAFDPYADIQRDWQGLYRWDGRKPKLRDAARRFFLNRNEDSTDLLDASRPLV